LWQSRAESAVRSIGKLARFASIRDMFRAAFAEKAPTEAKKLLEQAKTAEAEARNLLDESKYEDAIAAARKAHDLALQAYYRMVPPRPGEIRGVWMPGRIWTTWDEAMKNLKECGFNIALPLMCSAGGANYESAFLPPSDIMKEDGDQLKKCLAAAKKHGIQVHVWRVNWRVSSPSPEWLQKLEDEDRLMLSCEGTRKDGHGACWLCPSNPVNRKLEKDVMLEIVRKYHPAGIHFDYIRYPGSKFCYCPGCKARFEEAEKVQVAEWPKDVMPGGEHYERFMEWRRGQVTALVREVSEEARKLDPRIKISAAVFRDWENHRVSVGQDWKLWCEKGYLDFVCPMDYTAFPKTFRRDVLKQVQWVRGTVPLCPGIGAFSSGSTFRTPADLLYQIEIARKLGGDGYIIFHYNETLAKEFLPVLRLSANAGPNMSPLAAPDIRIEPPSQPVEAYHGAFPAGKLINFRIKVGEGVTGRIELESTSGRHIESFDAILQEDHRERTVQVRVPEGRSRLAIYGSVLLADGTSVDYVKRSSVIIGLSQSEVHAIEERIGPVHVPPGKGPRVAVVQEGFGSEAIYAVLSRRNEMRVFRAFNFRDDLFKNCDVLVLPQLREPSRLDSLTRNKIRRFVEQGGGLVVTHDAIGYRDHFPIVPEVALKATDNPKERQCKIAVEDPLTAGLTAGDTFTHSYYDHLVIQPGSLGKVVVTDLQDRPVIVRGTIEKGRCVAIGMATGLGDNNEEAEPKGAELTILLNAVRWAAGE